MWRDSRDWERFRTVWHLPGRMMATWFQGTADEFIAVSREGYERGVRILHFLGGNSVQAGRRSRPLRDQDDDLPASRGARRGGGRRLHGTLLRLLRASRRALGTGSSPADLRVRPHRRGGPCRRAGARSRTAGELSARIPAPGLSTDPHRLPVKPDMPGLDGPELDALYNRGERWLAGAAAAELALWNAAAAPATGRRRRRARRGAVSIRRSGVAELALGGLKHAGTILVSPLVGPGLLGALLVALGQDGLHLGGGQLVIAGPWLADAAGSRSGSGSWCGSRSCARRSRPWPGRSGRGRPAWHVISSAVSWS